MVGVQMSTSFSLHLVIMVAVIKIKAGSRKKLTVGLKQEVNSHLSAPSFHQHVLYCPVILSLNALLCMIAAAITEFCHLNLTILCFGSFTEIMHAVWS